MAIRGIKKKVTLKDIATKTGFTVNTVSRALRDTGDISEETKALIQKTAKDMRYIHNILAGALRSGKTKTIAIIIGDITNPHFAIMVKELEMIARKNHYNTFIINTDENDEIEKQAIYMALSKKVDGIILCPTQATRENITLLQHEGIPFVLCGRRFDDEHLDYVVCDDRKGGYLATKHLIGLGHTHILLLDGPTYISSAAERLEGYTQAFTEHKLPLAEELIRRISVKSGQCAQMIQQVLIEGIPFTAVFAFSDMIAYEVICALYEQGLKVPQDISVVGFDNIQAKLFFPFPLTTISSKTSMTRKAMDILLHLMKGEKKSEAYQEVIDASLVIRASTQPPTRR
jgi:LacI family transcriptional regulator